MSRHYDDFIYTRSDFESDHCPHCGTYSGFEIDCCEDAIDERLKRAEAEEEADLLDDEEEAR